MKKDIVKNIGNFIRYTYGSKIKTERFGRIIKTLKIGIIDGVRIRTTYYTSKGKRFYTYTDWNQKHVMNITKITKEQFEKLSKRTYEQFKKTIKLHKKCSQVELFVVNKVPYDEMYSRPLINVKGM